MKALIIAAGYATRLYPLTQDTPKALLLIAGKPMLNYIVKKIEELKDIEEIVVVTNDKFYPQFLEWSKSVKSAKRIRVMNDNTKSNEERLGAIGDIHYFISQDKFKGDLLVIGGDNLFDFNLNEMADLFKKKRKSIIALYDMQKKEAVAKRFGVVLIDKDFKIVDFEEKPAEPKSTLIATLCYMFSNDDIEELEKCISQNKKPDNAGDFIKYISSRKDVYGINYKGIWFDIGSFEQYEQADKLYADKRWIRKLKSY